MKINIILIFVLIIFKLKAQNNIELFGGISYTNVLAQNNDEQVVIGIPLNSPNYLWNYHLGILYDFKLERKLNVKIGFGLFGCGSKDFGTTIFPNRTVLSNRILYLKAPIAVFFKLLKTKQFYFKFGVQPCYKYRDSERSSDEINTYHLDYLLGFDFPLYRKVYGELSLSKDFISNSYSDTNIPDVKYNYLQYGFHFTLFYKL
jgi:hypothetical protein